MEGCTFVEGGPINEQEVLDFLNLYFVPLEPINAAIGLCEPGYRMPWFDAWVCSSLRKEGSVVIEARDEEGTLLGISIVTKEEKAEEEEEDEDDLPRWRQCPQKMRSILSLLGHLKCDLDVASQYGVTSWGDFMILACSTKRRVPGLGTALTTRAIAAMEEKGVKVITTTATSHYSARIFSKLGFTELKSLAYSEYTVDGKVVFPPTEPHTHAKLFVKS